MGTVLWWLRNNNCLPSLWFCQATWSQDHLFPSHSVHSGFSITDGVCFLRRAGKKWMFLFQRCSLATASSPITRTVSRSLVFSPTISYNLSLPRWSPSSTQIPLLFSCLLALTLIHLPPYFSCGPHSCTQLSAVSPHTEWHPSGIALNTQREQAQLPALQLRQKN